jgi:hypothetical protein
VITTAVTVGLVAWSFVRLIGIELILKEDAAMESVGAIDVVVATTLAGIAAWGVHTLLTRFDKARYWPFVGSTVLAISINGPSWFADGETTIALIAMHFAVGVVLITGFSIASQDRQCEEQPAYRPSGRGVGRPEQRPR